MMTKTHQYYNMDNNINVLNFPTESFLLGDSVKVICNLWGMEGKEGIITNTEDNNQYEITINDIIFSVTKDQIKKVYK